MPARLILVDLITQHHMTHRRYLRTLSLPHVIKRVELQDDCELVGNYMEKTFVCFKLLYKYLPGQIETEHVNVVTPIVAVLGIV
jgi:hypothetical protein